MPVKKKITLSIPYVDEVNRRLLSHEVAISVYAAKIKYVTTRNNEKTDIRYITVADDNKENIEKLFMKSIRQYNEEHPERALLNAKILSIKHEGYAHFNVA